MMLVTYLSIPSTQLPLSNFAMLKNFIALAALLLFSAPGAACAAVEPGAASPAPKSEIQIFEGVL